MSRRPPDAQRVPWLVLTCALLGCGDPIAPTDYQGTLMLETSVRIYINEQALLPVLDRPLRGGLFWSPGGLEAMDPETWVEQISTSVPDTVPDTFVLQVHALLPEAMQVRGADYGVGRLLIYADDNENGWRDPGEPRIAAVDNVGWVFTARALSAAESPTALSLEAGYHEVGLPLPCNTPPLTPSGADCDARLGAACAYDEDCGEAECFDAIGQVYNQGICAIEVTESACLPEGSASVGFVEGGPRYAVRACTRDTDCTRTGYTCDRGLGVCRSFERHGNVIQFNPEAFPDVPLRTSASLIPFCAHHPKRSAYVTRRPGEGGMMGGRPPRPDGGMGGPRPPRP